MSDDEQLAEPHSTSGSRASSSAATSSAPRKGLFDLIKGNRKGVAGEAKSSSTRGILSSDDSSDENGNSDKENGSRVVPPAITVAKTSKRVSTSQRKPFKKKKSQRQTRIVVTDGDSFAQTAITTNSVMKFDTRGLRKLFILAQPKHRGSRTTIHRPPIEKLVTGITGKDRFALEKLDFAEGFSELRHIDEGHRSIFQKVLTTEMLVDQSETSEDDGSEPESAAEEFLASPSEISMLNGASDEPEPRQIPIGTSSPLRQNFASPEDQPMTDHSSSDSAEDTPLTLSQQSSTSESSVISLLETAVQRASVADQVEIKVEAVPQAEEPLPRVASPVKIVPALNQPSIQDASENLLPEQISVSQGTSSVKSSPPRSHHELSSVVSEMPREITDDSGTVFHPQARPPFGSRASVSEDPEPQAARFPTIERDEVPRQTRGVVNGDYQRLSDGNQKASSENGMSWKTVGIAALALVVGAAIGLAGGYLAFRCKKE